jgi:secretion/DNA translocation related TadE-like protein
VNGREAGGDPRKGREGVGRRGWGEDRRSGRSEDQGRSGGEEQPGRGGDRGGGSGGGSEDRRRSRGNQRPGRGGDRVGERRDEGWCGRAGSRRAGLRQDRGAASIFVLAVGSVLVAAGLAGASIGTARVGRQQARTAADLGALAGAAQVIDGEGAACSRAGQLASANGGRMTACRLEGLTIVVEVVVPVTPLPGLTRLASAAARAGPVTAPVS